MAELLHTSWHFMDEAVRLHVVGEIDAATVEQFDWALTVATASARPRGAVRVDLGRATCFGAGATGSLVRARKAARMHGIRMMVEYAPPAIRRVLLLSGAADLMVEPRAPGHDHPGGLRRLATRGS